MKIDMGDDERYNMTSIGTINFQREFGSPVMFNNVTRVPDRKKNLVFVAVLESDWYDVIFNKRNPFMRHITMEQVKHIRV